MRKTPLYLTAKFILPRQRQSNNNKHKNQEYLKSTKGMELFIFVKSFVVCLLIFLHSNMFRLFLILLHNDTYKNNLMLYISMNNVHKIL